MGASYKLLFTIIITCFQLTAAAQQSDLFGGEEELYPTPKRMRLRVAQDEFKIMSYNVLNLFDNEHDVEDGVSKLDHTFLPLNYPGKAIECQKLSRDYYRKDCLKTNWTDEKLALKLKQIEKSVRIQGSLPDLLALEEVENENVISMLGQVLGYDYYVMTRSPDKRGIDVALLFNQKKLEYIEHQEIDVSSAVGFRTRNILRVNFRPRVGRYKDRKTIGVYVNHWPSQAAGSIARYTAAQVLATAIDQQIETYGSEHYYVIATGDFNTLERDSPNPFHDLLTSPFQWSNFLYDVNTLSDSSRNPMKYHMPPGTYWYGRSGKYNKFDRFFVSQNLYSPEGAQVVPESFRIVGTRLNSVHYKYKKRSPEFYPVDQLVPFRYNFNTVDVDRLGFSDHYPIVVKFKIK